MSLTCFAQKIDSIIYFPLETSDIEMRGRVLKMLKRNNVSEDSVKTYIVSSSTGKLKENFRNCITLKNNPQYKFLRDSLGILSQWSSFHIKKIEESKGFEKIVLANDESEQNRYYGHTTNKQWLDTLRSLMKKNTSNYTICLNKFEITNSSFATNDACFILHVEVYDENTNKVFGGKFSSEHSLSKYTSYSLFPYVIRNTIDDFYTRLKEYIK